MSDDISIVLESTDEIINVTIDDSVYAITNWGAIYGNISDQADLKSALDAKLDLADVSDSAEPGKVLRLNGSSSFDVNITGNAGTASSVQWTGVQNKPATYPPTAHAHTGVYQPAMGADDNYVTDAEKVKLSNLSGVNTGDQDLSGLCAGNDARLSDARTPLAHTTSSHSDWPASVSMTEVGYLDGVTSSIQTQLDEKENASNKGQALGYCPLDGSAKVAEAYLPDSVLGQVEYQGVWNATTNTPAIPAASTANKNWYYIVSVSGTTTIDGVSEWTIGDWIISNGVSWNKIDNTDSVSSVFGRAGAIVANAGDYTASQVTNVPAGNIAATTVQAAINELDTEKASATDSRFVTNGNSHDHVGGDGAAISLTSAVTGVLPIANGGTGSNVQNFVDLTSNQTIGGVKTFSSNLLIGPTTDDGVNKLQVNGSGYFSKSASGATAEILRLANTGSGANTTAQLVFAAAGTSYARITGGYGATAPVLKYDVITGGSHVWQVNSTDVATLTSSGLSVGTTDSTAIVSAGGLNTHLTVQAVGADGAVIFKTNGAERARVASSGNLLVGTTTDDGVRVNVDTNVSGTNTVIAYGLQLQTTQTGAYFSRSGVLFKWNDPGNHVSWQTGSVVSGAAAFDGNNKSGFLAFYTKPFTTSSVDLVERARIASSGNLLIGTTIDDGVNKLQVNGSGYFADRITSPKALVAGGLVFNGWADRPVLQDGQISIVGDSATGVKISLNSGGVTRSIVLTLS